MKMATPALSDQIIWMPQLPPPKTAPSAPINYLVPRPTPPHSPTKYSQKRTPTVTMSDQPDTTDAQTTLPTPAITTPEEDAVTTPSLEEASSNRSKETRDD